MARTTITKQTVAGPNPTAGTALTWTAADTTNLNQLALTGKELLLARNVHATTAFTVTVTSVEDPFKRTRNITADSIAALAFRIYGVFGVEGWRQTDGFLYFEANDANIQFAVLALP